MSLAMFALEANFNSFGGAHAHYCSYDGRSR
jgi:hypothetical protein